MSYECHVHVEFQGQRQRFLVAKKMQFCGTAWLDLKAQRKTNWHDYLVPDCDIKVDDTVGGQIEAVIQVLAWIIQSII